uniref:Uncharacterized protein n=1 Tax=Rhizophora mucronata TaxID=61149 RepID=A0A2P2ILZ0_RHIMU
MLFLCFGIWKMRKLRLGPSSFDQICVLFSGRLVED